MKSLFLSILALFTSIGVIYAQQYDGMTGLIHVPSAEMDTVGQVRIGGHYLDGNMTPEHRYWMDHGKKYNTGSIYMSITPFSWMEIGYTMVIFKVTDTEYVHDKDGYNRKDRHFSVKFRPLKEGKYWPSVAIGASDFLNSKFLKNSPNDDTSHTSNDFFRCFYLTLSKGFEFGGNRISATAAYRTYTADYNHRWQGVVGGLVWQPWFARGHKVLSDMRVIAEWDGCEVNCGIDVTLWRHFILQASLQNGHNPSAGLCYTVNLF